jgi:uncharacterized membrane protein
MGIVFIDQYPFFYNPIFLGLSSCGVIFSIAGIILLKKPPKEINFIYGYRTTSSMKNETVWKFAQKLSAKYLVIIGALQILISLLGFIYHPKIEYAIAITLIVIFGSIVLKVVLIENKLKKFLSKNNKP